MVGIYPIKRGIYIFLRKTRGFYSGLPKCALKQVPALVCSCSEFNAESLVQDNLPVIRKIRVRMSQAKYARCIGLGWAWIKMCRKQGQDYIMR